MLESNALDWVYSENSPSRDYDDNASTWGLESDGSFSVKSAYRTRFNDVGIKASKWKLLWSLKLPEQVLLAV